MIKSEHENKLISKDIIKIMSDKEIEDYSKREDKDFVEALLKADERYKQSSDKVKVLPEPE